MLWTLLGAVGIWLASANLRESRRDIEALHAMNGGTFAKFRVMRIVAYGHYRNDLFRLSKHCCIFFIGVLACVLPPQNPSAPISAVSLVITGGLFGISLLLVLASALDKRQRDVLEDIEDEARQAGLQAG